MKNNIYNDKTWKEFVISDLFFVSTSKDVNLFNSNIGTTPYIASSSENNGVTGYVDTTPSQSANTMTISRNGSICSVFYQSKPYCCSPDDIRILTPRFKFNLYIALFIKTILEKEKFRYAYGRKLGTKRIEKMIIKLPATMYGKPDYDFMERYIKSLRYKSIATANTHNAFSLRDGRYWREFLLGDLFSFYKGKRLTKEDMIDGQVNFVGAISENNGIRQQIDIVAMFEPNCITVNYNGSVGEAFYQSTPFWASDDVNVLYAKDWTLNKYIALFIATIIKANRYKFSYGRKWTLDKMKESPIKLPVDKKGSPDWDYMENYIKALPYSDRI